MTWHIKPGEADSPPGRKDDSGKPMAGLLLDFSQALEGVVDVATFGAREKYERGNWLHVEGGRVRYYDAFWRHLLKSGVEERDRETGLLHLEHAAWNLLAVIELIKRNETDDRLQN